MSATQPTPTAALRRVRRPTAQRGSVLRLRWLARIPRAARVCAVVAFLNAAAWALITPPFQVLDETDHFAYVQQLAENGSLPTSTQRNYSQEETRIMEDLNFFNVVYQPQGRPIQSSAEQRKLQRDLSQPLSRRGTGATGLSSSQPPLYYALETIPYGLASSGTILDRILLMRLMSALMGGLTALFAFLFLREALPAARWAWTVGGLGVAFAPLLAISSGGVTPDAMLFAVSAALFYCLARAFRRGLSLRAAIAIGALIAVGFLTKLNFIGLAPGAMLGLVLLAVREAKVRGRAVYSRELAIGLGLAVSPVVLYAIANVLSNHSTFGVVSAMGAVVLHGRAAHAISYVWQLYLPRLPWMSNEFGELLTTRQIWFRDLVGLYGWNDTPFPGWVYGMAWVPAGLIAGLCLRSLVVARGHLRRRAGELVTYSAMCLGLLIVIGVASYEHAPISLLEYAQPRYLVPLIVAWGAVLTLAARGAGRRWGPVVGALLVVLVIGHDVFSQLQVIARYYG